MKEVTGRFQQSATPSSLSQKGFFEGEKRLGREDCRAHFRLAWIAPKRNQRDHLDAPACIQMSLVLQLEHLYKPWG